MQRLRDLIENPRVYRPLVGVGVVIVTGLVGWAAWAWNDSRLPGRYSAMEFGAVDLGGGTPVDHHHGAVSLASLRGPQGPPDRRFVLTALEKRVRLGSGRTIEAWTFDGRVPGPELRVRQGDLVEITIVNRDIGPGLSVHWHGVDVANAEDGVAGVTQNAVEPGGRQTYRFRAGQAGTYWYHAHQESSKEVEKGLFGPLVVLPPDAAPRGLDLPVVAHRFGGVETLNAADALERHRVAPGTPVRLRLVNSESSPKWLSLDGTPFRVAAIDGTDLNRPTPITNRALKIAAGGRYDVTFAMPAEPVSLRLLGASAALVLSKDGGGEPPTSDFGRDFDPAAYGVARVEPITATSHFDRTFVVEIGRHLGFQDGAFGYHWTINGHTYPSMPSFGVRLGDLVKITYVNHTNSDHPMHLHGHHVLVLSRNGKPVTGSPWWVDTLNVGPDERYEVAFRASNSGIWMLHCHDLAHAAAGLVTHVAYNGVTTPYQLGRDSGNRPE